MSAALFKRVRSLPGAWLTPTERTVLLLLAFDARPATGIAAPGLDQLMEWLGRHDERNVRRALAGLCEKRALPDGSVRPPLLLRVGGGFRRRATEYAVLPGDGAEADGPEEGLPNPPFRGGEEGQRRA